MKKFLSRYPWLYTIFWTICNRKDEKSFALLRGATSNPDLVELHSGKKPFPHGAMCVIQSGGASDGFFACIRWVLDGCYFCDQHGFIPLILFPENGLYQDESRTDKYNAFSYYFTQPYEAYLPKVDEYNHVCYYYRNVMLAENLNSKGGYLWDENYISQMAIIMEKYLHFTDEAAAEVTREIEKRGVNANALGVHIRGTDYKVGYNTHPVYVSPQMYFEHIDQAMKQYGFSKIYIATDDQEILDTFIDHYGEEKLLYAHDNIRGTGDKGIHTSDNSERYRLGMEVLCDMAALAQCGGIISGISQVALITRVYKKSKGQEFVYDKVIHKGIHNNKNNYYKKK